VTQKLTADRTISIACSIAWRSTAPAIFTMRSGHLRHRLHGAGLARKLHARISCCGRHRPGGADHASRGEVPAVTTIPDAKLEHERAVLSALAAAIVQTCDKAETGLPSSAGRGKTGRPGVLTSPVDHQLSVGSLSIRAFHSSGVAEIVLILPLGSSLVRMRLAPSNSTQTFAPRWFSPR